LEPSELLPSLLRPSFASACSVIFKELHLIQGNEIIINNNNTRHAILHFSTFGSALVLYAF
jgi:hypothetical protein